MIERRPLLGFLWPHTAPGPLDHDARQDRWLRIPPRGPWRWALLVALSLAWISALPSALSALFVAPSFYALALAVAVLLPTGALLLRGWVAGTYVSDRGVKVLRILSTTFISWDDVVDVRAESTRRGWLGTPIPVATRAIALDTPEELVSTTITAVGPDLWLRPQAWDACADRFRLWWRETRD